MRRKGPCTRLLAWLLSATVWAGTLGLRTGRPVWSIPYDEQNRAEVNVTSLALRPRLGGGFWEDKLQQWQAVSSLFYKRGRGRLTYVEDESFVQGVNRSINSLGSVRDLGGERALSSIALLAAVTVGLPLALCVVLYGVERLQESRGVAQTDPDSHEGGSVSIVMSGPPEAASRSPGVAEVRHHQRLICPFQTHDYTGHDDGRGMIMLLLGAVQDVLVGTSTALLVLLDVMSFSFFTGVSLLNSLWAGCIVCVSTALVGGRPGMISSTSAATAVVLARVSRDPDMGLGPMALCVFIAGVLQVLAAAFRLSRFVTLIPHSVVAGCISGLAIITFCAQLRHYHYNDDGQWISNTFWPVTITAVFTVMVATVWCRVPGLRDLLPAPLVSILAAFGFSYVCQSWLPPRTLGDIVGEGTLSGGLDALPAWDFPPKGVDFHSLRMWAGVVPNAVRFALAGLFESLMTQSLIDEITGTSTSMRRECLGQGVANIVAAFFGAQGGGAVAVQSFMNVGSGGARRRLPGFVTGVLLCLSVVRLGPWVKDLPAAAPLGLVAIASANTLAWGVTELFSRHRLFDFLVAAFVTVLTIWDDVAAAVVAGVVVSMLGFAWKVATSLRVESVAHSATQRTLYLRGPLFFGSALSYRSEINPAGIKEDLVILDFTNSRILDIAGIEKTRDQLRCAGKSVVVQGVPPDAALHLEGQPNPASDGGGS